MKKETLDIMIINFRNIKEISDEVNDPRVSNIGISEEEYIKNVKKQIQYIKIFWIKTQIIKLLK